MNTHLHIIFSIQFLTSSVRFKCKIYMLSNDYRIRRLVLIIADLVTQFSWHIRIAIPLRPRPCVDNRCLNVLSRLLEGTRAPPSSVFSPKSFTDAPHPPKAFFYDNAILTYFICIMEYIGIRSY